MRSLLEEAKNRKDLLEQIIAEKEKALETAPKGYLRYCKSGNRIQYYHRNDPKDYSGTYIRSEQKKLAEKLAQKDYDQRILAAAQKERDALDRLLRQYNGKFVEEIYGSLALPRQELIQTNIISDEQYAKSWQKEQYDKKIMSEDAPEYFTQKGEQVRSKTELIIANTLNRMNVPYHYERPLFLQGAGIIHPDFTVLNIRKRKEYYWEHLGMMDRNTYSEKALQRINMYEQNGYYPGDKLLLTHETGDCPIKTRQIETMIRKFLL